MRWRGRRKSTNVEDRRRLSPRKAAAGGGIGAIILVVAVLLLGGDPSKLLSGVGGDPARIRSGPPPSASEDELAEFVKVVLADTEDVWKAEFRKMGRSYEEPRLVLYRGKTETAGGIADSSIGPFYMPADKTIYIDLSFYTQMRQDLNAPGDFAQAYVIAHEVGHHVQNLLGISDRVHRARNRVSETEYNRLSVRLELQADFYAGLWAHHAQKRFRILEPGDLEEALGAASAIGDDTLQRRAGGRVQPDTFTHGTSAQRVAWFRRGFETGELERGDTFDDANFGRR